MQQLAEIVRVALHIRVLDISIRRRMVRRGIPLLLVLALAGCSGHDQSNGESNGNKSNETRILRRGLPGEPQTLDPQLADDTFSFPVLRDLYEGLTDEGPKGEVEPGVAESWKVDDTGTVYDFKLRSGAKWSNGDPITATEFVQALRRAVDPKAASGSSALLAAIKGSSDITAGRKPPEALAVEASGNDSLRIELEHPAPFILQVLSQPIAAPLHPGSAPKKAITNGPYTLVTRIPGSFIELAKNPNYWDAAKVRIGRVRYMNAESEATEIREYEAGQIDMTSTIPAPDLERITKHYGSEVQTAPILGTLYLGLDVSEPPLKDNRDLRQALSMAVDRELIAEHVVVGVNPAYSFVSKGVSGYQAPSYDWSTWPRNQRISFARTLYARSGYSDKRPLHLTLYFNSGESIQRIMIAVAANWKANLGVTTDLVSDEFRVFLSGRRDRSKWDAIRLGWYADYDDPASFLEVFSKNNIQNDPGYASQKFNDLIDAARIEPNPHNRIELLRSAEATLLSDYPIIPVYFYIARRLVKPDLGGAEISPMNHTYSKHLYWKH
ncbi:MAG TPA: peptide ABC transporter substrate-binding protein [Steroidobacteraceae bacterium]|nr:peptide ABC transporter substrate-binding protein [Steroidobacteraceae bacterium]